ncbi:probable E3 ubiquitin-protein ligase RNF217 [Punica granatum]|uniref:RBR-type E3 ubiquitin transferase n=2 Tax=Punica granatum TaxID=22663 RepID=A0A2I0L5N4_PUNGR|nr:probable E3 ubiquitin-protein ligase RNF217 [Punica granatum]PKI76031.1 hypothetical protein CRG98_003581 [Punica granatum]
MSQAGAKAAGHPTPPPPPPPSAPEVVDLESEDFAWGYSTPITPSGRGSTKQQPISVEQYSEERDLQIAIAASLSTTTSSPPAFVDLSSDGVRVIDVDEYDEDAVLALQLGWFFETPSSSRRKRPFSETWVTERGESSSSKARPPPFMCEICAESKDGDDLFHVQGCTHSYCKECISRYVASKLQESITSIKCPEVVCSGRLEPEHCRSILPQEVFDRWGSSLCEALILGSEKFYSPFKDCSVMLINDGSQVVKESECPYCYRMFCAQCRVPWHDGIKCEEFQKLNKNEREREDIMLTQLAKKKKWTRCPKCHFYVEKVAGCLFVWCRCGVEFCYKCGTQSRTSHYCANCRH